MRVSFKSESLPSHEDMLKLVKLTEEHYFARKRNVRELGWCAN